MANVLNVQETATMIQIVLASLDVHIELETMWKKMFLVVLGMELTALDTGTFVSFDINIVQ